MVKSGPAFALGRIGQIALTVSDVDRAIEFYRDKLGMSFLFQAPNLAFFDCDGIRLMLSGIETPGETFSSIVYFKVDDLDRAFEALTARGIEFERKPERIAQMEKHDLWMAFLRDPDRNLLGLMSEIPRV